MADNYIKAWREGKGREKYRRYKLQVQLKRAIERMEKTKKLVAKISAELEGTR